LPSFPTRRSSDLRRAPPAPSGHGGPAPGPGDRDRALSRLSHRPATALRLPPQFGPGDECYPGDHLRPVPVRRRTPADGGPHPGGGAASPGGGGGAADGRARGGDGPPGGRRPDPGRSGRPGGDRGTRDGARGPGLPPAGGEAEPPGGPNPPPRPRPAVARPLARRPPGVVGSGAGGPVCAPFCGPEPDDQPVPYGPDEVDG